MYMQTTSPPPARHQPGFTLIEVLVTMVIIAILTAIALPSYNKYVQKGKRGAAKAMMMDLANREEQYLLANRSYADKDAMIAGGFALPANVDTSYSWDVALGAGTVPAYTITFTAINSQVPDGDLTLNSAGVKGPADKW